jgi:DNA-binding CsgD family transcriptional regulator
MVRLVRLQGHGPVPRGPLSEALEETEACGGTRLAGQALAELKASGSRRPRHSSTQLSTQERNVTALAAERATNEEIANRLFISVKTVEDHLTSAYSKLGVRSRKELPHRLQERRRPTTRQPCWDQPIVPEKDIDESDRLIVHVVACRPITEIVTAWPRNWDIAR